MSCPTFLGGGGWLMFTNRFDNHKSIWAISVKYQSDTKWVGEQKGILHFRLNSIAANLFIIAAHVQSSITVCPVFFSSLPPGISMSGLEKNSLNYWQFRMIVILMLVRCFLLLRGTCRARSFRHGRRYTRSLLSSSPILLHWGWWGRRWEWISRSFRHEGQGQRQRGWRVIISWIMKVHVYYSMVSTLCHVSRIKYTSTHLIHKQIDQGDVPD